VHRGLVRVVERDDFHLSRFKVGQGEGEVFCHGVVEGGIPPAHILANRVGFVAVQQEQQVARSGAEQVNQPARAALRGRVGFEDFGAGGRAFDANFLGEGRAGRAAKNAGSLGRQGFSEFFF
jgi:hypothetical protein